MTEFRCVCPGLKDNHPTLHQQVKNWFKTAQSLNFKGVDVSISQRVEKGHHRIENRTVYTVPISQLPALYEQNQWAGLTTVVMVVRKVQHWNKTTHEIQFYITSLDSDANKIGSAVRQHWGIENSVHWTLEFLSFYLSELEKDDLLKTAMQQVINSDIPIQIDSTQALKLRSLGLIEFKGNEVQCLCDLYRLYFRERL
ncbi:ISAs1 family transposase [Dolichospermum flos-aquae]|uniref:ISAs1 family transposase n=1 Tax=Dolichospermum flosaquae TaxID=1166 RepID=UPI002277731E|nr:ISAs1 family transposase [Dolichospermum flos-aquae]